MLFAPRICFQIVGCGIGLGNIHTERIGPYHCDILNESQSVMLYFAASKPFADFFWNFFPSVRMSLCLIPKFLPLTSFFDV